MPWIQVIFSKLSYEAFVRHDLFFRLAYVEGAVFLSVLLRKFRMKLANPSQVVAPIFGLVTHPDDEIWIMLELIK